MSQRVKIGTFNRKCAAVGKSAVYIIKQGSRRVDAYLYDLAWKTVRAKRKHAPLENELLWHKVYEEYIGSLPKAGGELIERHLRIVPAIAGRIAWKRCPGSFGVWAKEAQPSLSHVGLVYELTALGNLALFIAADRYDPKSGRAFSNS
jgi:DNA-directed RNA polymerase sigma subunit (sigma70/sigma32)